MTINPVKTTNIGGRNFATREYMAAVKSDNWLIHSVGIGELGNPDGSQFSLLEKIGYPKQAIAGFDFNFNIFALQLPQNFDFWAVQSTLATYVKETYKAAKLGMTGYSLAGRGCWTCLQGDSKGYFDFIAPIAGYYDSSQGPVCSLRSIPIYAWHGDKDTTMMYAYDRDNIAAYNACTGRPTQIIDGVKQPCAYLKTLAGVTHNSWDTAYDVTPGKDSLLQWINQQFGPAPIPQPTIRVNGVDTGISPPILNIEVK